MCLKNKIKRIINTYPKLDIENIKKTLDKYEYISFDIFDTLIKRDVENPNEVFAIIGKIYFKKSNTFKEDRLNAEKQTRKELNDKEEILLDDIYNMLIKDYNYSQEDAKKLKDLEINIEINLCTKNKEIYEVYKHCLKNNKKIIVVSNMYLDEKIINKILKNNGYEQYKLYLSSTIGKKKNGTLFEYVLNDLNIKSNQILHIGDSYRNDYLSAKKNKIKALRIPRNVNKLTHSENKQIIEKDILFTKSLNSFTNNRLSNQEDKYYNFGYQSFGILLYGFNKYMHYNLEKKGIKDIFFFSRDGYIIKKVYDEMYPNDEIKSHYIYVSRRSLRVPQIWTNPELENVVKSFPLAKMLSMETFLNNIGLNPNNYTKILNEYNLELKTTIFKKDILNNQNIIDFYNEIKQDVINHSKAECNLLLEYFKQENFKGKVAIVDIGWHASLQYFIDNLAKKCKYDIDMEGYYIGLAKEAKTGIKTNGYIIDFDSKTNSCDSWKSYNGLIETLFLAQEGSTKTFKKQGPKIKPVLYKYEYSKETGEKEKEALYVESLQQGAVDFAKDFKKSILAQIDFCSFTAYRKIYLTGIYPNKKDLIMFSKFRFLEEKIEYLAMPKKLLYYFTHLKALKKDLFSSRWKIGFMKNLFKINLPYLKFYQILRKMSS